MGRSQASQGSKEEVLGRGWRGDPWGASERPAQSYPSAHLYPLTGHITLIFSLTLHHPFTPSSLPHRCPKMLILQELLF